MHFSGCLWTVTSIYPYTFDANPRTTEGPMVYVAKATRSKRLWINVENRGRKFVRRREYPLRAAHGF